eukprot:437053_1
MSLIRFHKLSLLHILLCSFIHNIICSNLSNHPYTQSIHSLSTLSTSFIIPITLHHSKWFISNRNPPTNTLISLQSFLNTLTNSQQHLIIQLQIDSIQTYNNPFLIDHFKQLYNIINQSNISISKNIIISQEIPIQIIQTISNENFSITINIHPISTLIQHKSSRILLSNDTNTQISNTEYKIIEIESWICKPWPIYLGFFAGIGVTVIITFVMNLTTGEKDVELNNALAKFVTAGTETSMICGGAVEIIAGPTRNRKARTNSTIVLYHTNQLSLSPKSHTRSHSYIKRPQINQKHPNEPSWAVDLQIPLTLNGVAPSIEEADENGSNDSNDSNNNNNNNIETIQYDQLKDHRNSLRIYTKNLLNAPNTIAPIQTDITPKSDDNNDIYLSNSSDSTIGQKTSDEMSLSELTNNGRKSQDSESETLDSPIRIIKHKEFDYSDAIQQQENKNNLKLAQNIDLSPIVESVVNFNEFKTRQQRQQRYRVKSMINNDGMHIRNLNGQKIRVGLNISNNDIKPYDCLGTSSENSGSTSNDHDNNHNDETNIDDDGLEGDDETDVDDEVP